jgi:hypothetical protein
MTRQEVYDNILQGKQIYEDEVFTNLIVYSPLGSPMAVPATDRNLQQWNNHNKLLDF